MHGIASAAPSRIGLLLLDLSGFELLAQLPDRCNGIQFGYLSLHKFGEEAPCFRCVDIPFAQEFLKPCIKQIKIGCCIILIYINYRANELSVYRQISLLTEKIWLQLM